MYDVEKLANDCMKWHFWADYTTFLDCLITYSTIVTVLCLQGGRSATIIL